MFIGYFDIEKTGLLVKEKGRLRMDLKCYYRNTIVLEIQRTNLTLGYLIV